MVARRDLERFAKTRLSKKADNILAIARVRQFARLDIGRELRKGLPEVVLAEGKDARDVAEIVAAVVKRTGRAIVSRADRSYLTRIRAKRIAQTRVIFYEKAGMITVKRFSYKTTNTGGRVGLLTAGTSDIPVAEEARIIADEMGCETRSYYDVGVAGLHRLFEPLAQLLRWDADVILVIAGREGALPTVVAGLVDVPVIAVPTSRSYGFGDRGIAAMAAMLQSCSLGLAVVNIDSGVGAGSIGGLIANRAAKDRPLRRRA
jgi:pyridinium-3,5-biscarboxylic acid mononucleotide synthase